MQTGDSNETTFYNKISYVIEFRNAWITICKPNVNCVELKTMHSNLSKAVKDCVNIPMKYSRCQ